MDQQAIIISSYSIHGNVKLQICDAKVKFFVLLCQTDCTVNTGPPDTCEYLDIIKIKQL